MWILTVTGSLDLGNKHIRIIYTTTGVEKVFAKAYLYAGLTTA